MHGTCSASGAIALSFITLQNHLLNGFFLYAQVDPSAISTAVVVPAGTEPDGKETDPLQKHVDPKLLVSSKSRGPPRHHYVPTLLPTRGKVFLHHASCAWRDLPDWLDTLTL